MNCNDVCRLVRFALTLVMVAMGFAGVAASGPLAYLATARQGEAVSASSTNPFGVLDLATGSFSQRGITPVLVGLGADNGILYGVDVFDRLVTINPSDAVLSVVGSLGISSAAPNPAYGSFDVFASLTGGGLYWDNNLYSVDPSTGAATLVGPTGIPVIAPGLFFATGMSADAGALYFNIGEIDPATFTEVIPASLYHIDPATGNATVVGGLPTLPFLGAGFVDGYIYIGKDDARGLVPPSEIWKFDPSNATVLSSVRLDPALDGFSVFAMSAVPSPEPGYAPLVGFLGVAFGMRRLQKQR